jgi:hypothetical protein
MALHDFNDAPPQPRWGVNAGAPAQTEIAPPPAIKVAQQPAVEPPPPPQALDAPPPATGGRYVITRDAEAAVLNHETELFDAMGIRWRDGNPHITCPLTRWHPDDKDPSFNWDSGKRRAFCTCIPKNHPKGYKTLAILGIVAEAKGLTYDDAKVWACEALGRTDLIKTRGKGSAGDGVAALLAPPAHLRDDEIVANYLGFRLGIAPAEVPMPATPVAGWTKLGYYDPPPTGSKSKPVKVGDFRAPASA